MKGRKEGRKQKKRGKNDQRKEEKKEGRFSQSTKLKWIYIYIIYIYNANYLTVASLFIDFESL